MITKMRQLRSKGVYVRDGEDVGRRVVAEGRFKNRHGKVTKTVTYSTGKRTTTILRKSFLAWLNAKPWAFWKPAELASNDVPQ